MSSFSRQQLEKWLKTIYLPKGARILDVGGSQNPIKGRVIPYDENHKFTILDLENPHETKQKPDIIADIQNDFELPICQTGYEEYDVAFCIEVSEYWYNPLQALKNINRLLKKGGILYISFHFIYEIHNPLMYDYLRYTPRGAERLLNEAGFEVKEVVYRQFQYPIKAREIFQFEGMRGLRELSDIQGCLIKALKI